MADPTAPSVDTPAISVVMPVYNAAKFLVAAIDSVLNQTMGDFEFLIIDDGSTDRSADIIRTYDDPRIHFISRENRGAVTTRNELAALARAPYLAVMDADDVCLPARFEKQYAFLENHDDIGLLGGRATYIDVGGRPIFTPKLPTDPDEIDAHNIDCQCSLIHPSIMMRRSVFDHVGGYDPAYPAAHDLELYLRVAEHGRLANLPDVILEYRLVDASISGRQAGKQRQLAEQACQTALSRRGLPERNFSQETPWRPSRSKTGRLEFTIRLGWQAWRAGHFSSSRHFFCKAILLNPFSWAAWKGAVLSSLRKPNEDT